MTINSDYKIAALFEKAKNDASWENDPAARAKLADGLLRSLIASLS